MVEHHHKTLNFFSLVMVEELRPCKMHSSRTIENFTYIIRSCYVRTVTSKSTNTIDQYWYG